MRILSLYSRAEERSRELYHHRHVLFKKAETGLETFGVDWRRSNPRVEYISGERKSAALTLYLEVAHASPNSLPANTFPALFEFGRMRMRPDKGVIKALLEHYVLSHRFLGQESVFDVDPSIRARLGL